MMHNQFLKTFSENTPTPPIIIDENGCLILLAELTSKHLNSLDDCRGGDIPSVSLYEIQEDKKLFDITTVRNCIRDIGLKPYSGKQIYILRGIDKGTPEAMNALLKILEECPLYASIMLVVDNSEGLLETIHSRCMNFHHTSEVGNISDELRQAFDAYIQGDVTRFSSELYSRKFEKDEAITLLRYAILCGSSENIEGYEQGIIDIRMSHESPRNILDSLFIIPR